MSDAAQNLKEQEAIKIVEELVNENKINAAS